MINTFNNSPLKSGTTYIFKNMIVGSDFTSDGIIKQKTIKMIFLRETLGKTKKYLFRSEKGGWKESFTLWQLIENLVVTKDGIFQTAKKGLSKTHSSYSLAPRHEIKIPEQVSRVTSLRAIFKEESNGIGKF